MVDKESYFKKEIAQLILIRQLLLSLTAFAVYYRLFSYLP